MSGSKPGKIIASRPELIAMHERLRAVLLPAAEGRFAYSEGWDDARVAKDAAPRLTAHHVRHLREELFGDLAKPNPRAEAELVARIGVLDEALGKLAGIVERQQTLLEQLYRRLGEPVPS